MSILLETYKIYTQKHKLKIIPVLEDSKRPAFADWTTHHNPEAIKSYFEANPKANMGLLLGEIIDVEADKECGNKYLNDQILRDYPHPKWKSNKSIHHLFRHPKIRHGKRINCNRFQQGIEFRGYGGHSVLPPSIVAGIRYDWLPGELFIPEMPQSLFRFYIHEIKQKKKKIIYCINNKVY
jgi:hypothetical protein